MNEYIEREALITELNDIAIDLLKDNSIQCSLAAGTVIDIKDNVVAKQPTADVVEVRHGEWVMGLDEADYEYGTCSVCGYIECDVFPRGDYPYYCSHCGARMDRGVLKDDRN